MKKINPLLKLAFLQLLVAVPISYGATLTNGLYGGGEMRLRYDHKNHGNGTKANNDFLNDGTDNTNGFLYLRTTLYGGYKNDLLEGFVQLRDNQVWDDQVANSKLDRSLDLYQAWIQIGKKKEHLFQAKIGRQQIGIGSNILIGIPNYKVGRTFDAIRLSVNHDNFSGDAIVGRVVRSREGYFNDDSNPNEMLSGLSLESKKVIPRFSSQTYLFGRHANSDASGGRRQIYSGGIYMKSLPDAFGKLHLYGEAIYQWGEIGSGSSELDHRSYLLHAGVSYKFKDYSWKPKLIAEYYHSPGDSNSKDSKSQTFDLMYPGKNHPRAGITDLVSWRNIHMIRLGLTTSPSMLKGLKLETNYWNFWLDDTNDYFYGQGGFTGRKKNGFGINPENSSYLGSEINIVAKYKINKHLSTKIKYAHFFTGDYIDQSLADNGGAQDVDLFSVSMQINF